MTVHITSKLFVLNQQELAFLQKVTRAEYQFITDEEQVARQLLRDKLNEVVLHPQLKRIAANLTTEELVFLAQIVKETFTFVTAKEREARQDLHDRLSAAAKTLAG